MKHDEFTCRQIILDCLLEYEEGTMADVYKRFKGPF